MNILSKLRKSKCRVEITSIHIDNNPIIFMCDSYTPIRDERGRLAMKLSGVKRVLYSKKRIDIISILKVTNGEFILKGIADLKMTI